MQRLPLAAALLALLPSCQDYTFDPVADCLIQPGSTRVQLASTSTADLLFVVDDSPSTDPKQAALAASFGDFISRMVQTNTDRVGHGLDPIDFHIAITTSSVFAAGPTGQRCRGDGAGGECCAVSACADAPGCTPGTAAGCGAGQLCVVEDVLAAGGSYKVGEQHRCCTPGACTPASPSCRAGEACPAVVTAYASPLPGGCTPGLAVAGAPFPAGAFVAAPGNPRVLAFDKALDWGSWGGPSPDPRLTALVQQFRQNVRVGSCGSGEEQHLQAARLALQRARAGEQPGVAPGAWPHPGAKLVVVWVGDEDDCSSPAAAPLVFAASAPGADSCVWDKHRPADRQQEYPVSDFAAFLAGLAGDGGAADLAAAFVVSGVACADGTFSPADACAGTPACPVAPAPACQPAAPVCGGAYAAGERFHALAGALRAGGTAVLEESVCDAFGPTLVAIADLARPPSALELDSRPAASEVTVLRVTRSDGAIRRLCAQGTDWCFVSCADGAPTPACLPAGNTSRCIAIAADGACQANPGEAYSVTYLGMVPAGGCATAADCAAALGARAAWACYAAPGQDRGTCVCGK